jgi:hypothetical protein
VSPPAARPVHPLLAGLALVGMLALLLGIATARQVELGRGAVRDADAALARGDLGAAVARARDAAEALAPGSPYPKEGYTRLEGIARSAEARGDETVAVAAWGAMRAAATASESPLASRGPWVELADDGLVRAGSRPLVPSAEVHASEAALRAALARREHHENETPPAGTLTLLGAGALAFFAGIARLGAAVHRGSPLVRERAALAAALLGGVAYAVVCLRA